MSQTRKHQENRLEKHFFHKNRHKTSSIETRLARHCDFFIFNLS
ncbi:MAG TPA: hypothetical protein DEB17_00310 [Chlorobaculum sp.]|uniref:Uncharacterized protein n=1 Tax=Chlorobaculum tepidum (strain ATCC 49652 / DSM 12025 / NBRC 103806 / TLS) TaxID=194439 RepID=Q8KC39_CHLTE|nr:hypothetical protein CT1587 [Chlorobaculum tepidum TLS]HBU22442.1 hypothetical protein [Chlorobaculum sp.]